MPDQALLIAAAILSVPTFLLLFFFAIGFAYNRNIGFCFILSENFAIYKKKQLGMGYAAFWVISPVITHADKRIFLFVTVSKYSSKRCPSTEFSSAFWEISPVIPMKQ